MESKICQYEEKEDEYRDAKFVSYLNDNNVFFKKICHDIKNSKEFSIETLEKINKLSYENRLRILSLYNEIIAQYILLFDEK